MTEQPSTLPDRKVTSMEELFLSAKEGQNLHVIADAANVANFVHIIDAYRLDYTCLFSGPAALDYEDVAPYMISVPAPTFYGDEFVWNLLIEGNAIGLHTAMPRQRLRVFIKRFLRIRTAEGIHFVKFYRGTNFEFCMRTIKEMNAFPMEMEAVWLPSSSLRPELVTHSVDQQQEVAQ